MAGGSQIRINDKGITTNGKILYQSSEHIFEGGREVKAEFPILPIVNSGKVFTNKWDFYDLFLEANFSEVKYKLINNKNNTFVSGVLDEHGRTQRMNTLNNEDYDILIGTDEDWTVSLDDGSEDIDFEYHCSCSSYGEHEHEDEI